MDADDTLNNIFRAAREGRWSASPPTDEEVALVEAQARRHFRACDFCGQISLSKYLRSREPWNCGLVEIKQFEDDLWVCEDCLQ